MLKASYTSSLRPHTLVPKVSTWSSSSRLDAGTVGHDHMHHTRIRPIFHLHLQLQRRIAVLQVLQVGAQVLQVGALCCSCCMWGLLCESEVVLCDEACHPRALDLRIDKVEVELLCDGGSCK